MAISPTTAKNLELQAMLYKVQVLENQIDSLLGAGGRRFRLGDEDQTVRERAIKAYIKKGWSVEYGTDNAGTYLFFKE